MRSEIAQDMEWDLIRYSVVWEDWRLLAKGLRITPDDDVLSVTSAGDNALALLSLAPRSVTAFDLNPSQSALLELKLAGIAALDHADFAGLLGLSPLADRVGCYERVRTRLSTAARGFWDNHTAVIEAGIAQSGRLEDYIHGFARDELPEIHSADVLGRLLQLDDIEAQRAYFDDVVATPAFIDAFRRYFGRENMAKNGRDPAQFRHVESGDVGAYFFERLRTVCTTLPLASNFYVEYFFTGRYRDLSRGPAYARPDVFARLKGLVDRVEVVTGELEGIVSAGRRGRFSKANLSDVFEYMSEEHSDALFERLASSFRAGGRLCYWNLLVPRHRPEAQADRIVRHTDLADALWRSDRSWFYRAFHVEEIR